MTDSYCWDPELNKRCTEEEKQRLRQTLQSSFRESSNKRLLILLYNLFGI